MSGRTIKPVRIESLLAGVLNVGTWLASVVIAAGLVLSLFYERTPFPTGAQVVTAGIGLFILLPILRVILMLTIFVKERDYKFAGAAAVVLLIIFAGFAIGILSKIGVTTRKCRNCPVREATAMLASSVIPAETRFSRCPKAAKAAVYRKVLFRDRNQISKRTLFTLKRRPDALRAVFSTRSIGANSRSTPKIVQIWFSRTGQF